MATTLYDIPQYTTTTLSVTGGIDASQTTGIVLASVSGIDITKPGIVCLSWTSTLNTAVAEFLTYTSINGSNELQGVTRGAEGISAKAHVNGVVVAFPVSKSHINKLNAAVNALEAIPTAPVDGWTAATGTWTYASASTITVPSGAASLYQKGDRIKFTQTTVKYAVIVAVADTLLTIAVNNDYTVANAAISANYYSHEMNPIGYPHWFGYDPTYTGFSAPPTADQQYRIDGNTITIRFVASGTSNSATFNMTVPVTPTTIGGGTEQFIVTVVDNSASPAQPGIIGVIHGSADLKVGINPSTRGGNSYGGFTTSGSKGVEGTVIFKF